MDNAQNTTQRKTYTKHTCTNLQTSLATFDKQGPGPGPPSIVGRGMERQAPQAQPWQTRLCGVAPQAPGERCQGVRGSHGAVGMKHGEKKAEVPRCTVRCVELYVLAGFLPIYLHLLHCGKIFKSA